jgi:Uma2 family endonuclease
MPDLLKRWTREDVLALPDDGNRYELVDGELLVTPSPRLLHQCGVMELVRIVDPYVRRHRLGLTCLAPCDLDLRTGQLVQPYLFVSRLVEGRRPAEWTEVRIPLLVAEILSPSTARYDRVVKRALYQRSQVPHYWAVDLDGRLVERWGPGDTRPEILVDRLIWQPDSRVAPLVVDLPAYFTEVWGG